MEKRELTAYLFPGQGSQVVGMGRDLLKHDGPTARLLELASDLTKQPLRRYCLDGPLELLSRTDVLQPCIAAVSLGCLSSLQEAGLAPDLVAGHSLGELVALVAAGVLSAHDAMHVVCARGRFMNEAASVRHGMMVAVTDVHAESISRLIEDLESLVVANYNSPRQTVLSGPAEAVLSAESALAGLGFRVVRLPVSGAWHSPLMAEANVAFREVLASLPFAQPRTPLFLNVTGRVAQTGKQVRSALEAQMVSPVRWYQSIESMIAAGATTFVEVGPGRVLRGLMRHIWMDYSAYKVLGVDGHASAAKLVQRTERAA